MGRIDHEGEPEPLALPEPTHIEGALGSLLIELEAEIPGITQRVRDRLEAASLQASISRIRGPRADPAYRRAIAMALHWLGGVMLHADAAWGPLAERVKRGKKRKR